MQVQLCQKNLDAFYSLWTDPPELLREVYDRDDGSQIILLFTSKALVFKANPDDDTLSVRSRNVATLQIHGSFTKSRSPIWQEFIGRAFGWGWVTVNQQGYCDGALLSFDGITPTAFLGVAASSIEISTVSPQEELQRTRGEVASLKTNKKPQRVKQ